MLAKGLPLVGEERVGVLPALEKLGEQVPDVPALHFAGHRGIQ